MNITTGLDFGTTNSTIGYNNGNNSELITLSNNKIPTRTVLFWNEDEKKMSIGDKGIGEYLDGYSGRLVQSVKSFLNSSIDISTYIGGKNRDIVDLCSIIIKGFKEKLESIIGEESDSVLIGRPVKFHDSDEQLDKKAQQRLYEAAKLAGYRNIEFEFEPIGAVLSYKEKCEQEENVLVVDLGGGTSDFSIVNINPNIKGVNGIHVLSNNGIYIGGDTLDYQLSINFFAKFLGKGTEIDSFGKILEIPKSYFLTLSDWKQINLLADRNIRSRIQSTYNISLSKDLLGRLLEISEDISKGYYYHDLVKESKEKLTFAERINETTNFFKNNFEFVLLLKEFEEIIESKVMEIREKIEETIKLSGLKNEEIDKVLITGGTGLVPLVRRMIGELVGEGKIIDIDTFNSVGYGLTLESYEKFR